MLIFSQILILPGLFIMKADSKMIEKYKLKKRDMRISTFDDQTSLDMSRSNLKIQTNNPWNLFPVYSILNSDAPFVACQKCTLFFMNIAFYLFYLSIFFKDYIYNR